MPTKPRLFTRFAKKAAHFTGTPLAFALALLIAREDTGDPDKGAAREPTATQA